MSSVPPAVAHRLEDPDVAQELLLAEHPRRLRGECPQQRVLLVVGRSSRLIASSPDSPANQSIRDSAQSLRVGSIPVIPATAVSSPLASRRRAQADCHDRHDPSRGVFAQRARRRSKRLAVPKTQKSLISTFTKTVSTIESTIDQMRHPGMKRTLVRSPDRFQITTIPGPSTRRSHAATAQTGDARDGRKRNVCRPHARFTPGPTGRSTDRLPSPTTPEAQAAAPRVAVPKTAVFFIESHPATSDCRRSQTRPSLCLSPFTA